MKFFVLVILAGLFYHLQIVKSQLSSKRLVCYYDAISSNYQGYPFNFKIRLLKALPKCTHLVYSAAQVQSQNFEIGKFNISPKPSTLKKQFPHLKILLSVGGKFELSKEYLKFLEAGDRSHQVFGENARRFLKGNNFDGLDVAFPFPRNQPRKTYTGIDAVIKKFKKMFADDEIIDVQAQLHKMKYTNFVRILNYEFRKENLMLSMTVLPNVNASWYFDIFKIHKNFEFINLLAFDFLTPSRNPEEADYSAPIYPKNYAGHVGFNNIDFQVNYWINNGCPANKLNLGIATYGRAWMLTTDSGLSGVPVVESANGAADPGKLSKIPGLLSWTEICIKLATKNYLKKVVDVEEKYGNYAFNPADVNNKNGIWISFDDPQFAGIKTEYAKQKGMGGVAVYNLQNDDFLKYCQGPVFPILSSISQRL